MEQAILTPNQYRWTNAVVKMTSLTYQGKLKWSREYPTDEAARGALAYPLAVYLGAISSVRYHTVFEGKTYVLIITSGFAVSVPAGDRSPDISLSVFEDGKRLLDFPKLSILRGLASAVQSQVDDSAEAVLSDIENA